MTENFQDEAVQEHDVIAAYQWVLGRDPESVSKVQTHLAKSVTVRDLRLSFLRSPEFSRTIDRLAILSDSAQQQVNAVPQIVNSVRLLFLHIPKTAGSSLFQAIESALPAPGLCPTRQNTLLTRPLIELGQYQAFFGHYDFRMIGLLPGEPCVFTMLRDPRERLISLYRYLRAHTAERVRVESLALAGVARECGLGEFLNKARLLAPATVDNTYVRTLGGALPLRRWEDRAEAGWLQNQSADTLSLLPAAQATLRRCDAVGVVEAFDSSIAAFNDVLEKKLGCTLRLPPRRQVTDGLAEISPGFETVAPRSALQAEVDAAADLLDELTVGDRLLYQTVCARLDHAR